MASETIFVIGCVDAAIQTAQNNMFLIGGIAVGIVVPQVRITFKQVPPQLTAVVSTIDSLLFLADRSLVEH